jgi:hypothetical protein
MVLLGADARTEAHRFGFASPTAASRFEQEDIMAALTRQLALVSESHVIPRGDVSRVAAAMQKQAARDLSPIWNISGTVDAFDSLEDVPAGYWPVIVQDGVPHGIHQDKDGQPFALITSSPDLDTWSLIASHEAFEMLVDPFGNTVQAGDSPKSGQGHVSFLVEVCDPCQAADFGYSVDGILVSDFYTPNYFDPVTAAGVRYDYTGSITGPRQTLMAGYLSWLDPSTGHWWQEIWSEGDRPSFRDIGVIDLKASGNLRVAIDRITMPDTLKAIARGRSHTKAAGLTATVVAKSSISKAARLREQIKEILAGVS